MSPTPLSPRRRDAPYEPAKCHYGRWVLSAEHGWVVEAGVDDCDKIVAALSREVCERLGEGMVLLSFGNNVGRYRAGPLGTLDVRTGKWGGADYDLLLERITEAAAALPFAAGTPSALPFDRTVIGSRDVLYHAFAYLRHVLGPTVSREQALLPMLQGITRNPHRRFLRQGREAPLDLARRVEPRVLQDVVRGRWPLEKVRGEPGPLAIALDRHEPSHIEESVTIDSLDTPENRFVGFFLDTASGVVERMRDLAGENRKAQSWRRRVLADCSDLERALLPVQRHGMWRDVSRMSHLPGASTVLQRRLEYRAVYRHFNRLRLGSRLPIDVATAERLLEVKNIALLYELWAFFAVVRAVRGAAGDPLAASRIAHDDCQVDVNWNYEVRWPTGIRVVYNPYFSRCLDRTQSYSVPLRPDVVLDVPAQGGNELHVFDAKFKVDWLHAALPEREDQSGEEEIARQEREGTFKRADIYKMHAYRDALTNARSAWALYPGTQLRFFFKGDNRMVERVEDFVEVSEGAPVKGVGAVPLPAGGVGEELKGIVRRLLRR